MRIGLREIGPARPPYVIAEIGVNHDGDASRALDLTEAAAEAGADAVKLQLFETDRLMSGASELAAYQRSAGETDPLGMLRRLELPIGAMGEIAARARARGLHAIVTVFSVELVAAADALGWDAYKVASPDAVHRPLIERLLSTGRPVIVSTGACTMEEVRRCAGWLGAARGRSMMMQCVSCYPAASADAALGGVGAIARETGLPVGYSDHTEEIETGARAVAAGAVLLEKHLTWSRRAAGPDHAASLEPDGLAAYVRAARGAVGTDAAGAAAGEKRVLACERDVRGVSRQSIVAARRIGAGSAIARGDVTFKRPGVGLEPWRVGEVVGRTAGRAIEADEAITPEALAPIGRRGGDG